MRSSTIYGPEALVALTVGACIAPGVAKIGSSAAKYLIGTLTGKVIGGYTNGTKVQIVMNRYIVRCADGTQVYRVYATYYDQYGNWMDSKLAQVGKY